ncbi:MAG: D-glycero-beta-D-manno-heptose-1,7-bisphosphate 7-phosphatase [Cycloclasticus sp. symbiont of Bathymodiolus heckerae]|nr:MAG: D-glycero-beta-D-manno-heptose-1,7-bisphosphate 7-phosphatase [Cycloclasticus sp. symbiont of Bathymodiolus heckerae]
MDKKSPIDIILDRDGVINLDSDAYVKSVNEWLPIDGSIQAIAMLHKAGHRVFVATNQSGIGRGYYSENILNDMHKKMLSLIHQAGGEIAGIAFCPHSPEDDCSCRKPKPGLFTSLAKKYCIDLTKAIVVGDSLRDLQAAVTVGSQPILVLTGKGKKTQLQNPHLPHPTFETLYDATKHLLS